MRKTAATSETPVGDMLKQMIRDGIKGGGWSSRTIAAEMRRIGHPGWKDETPWALSRPDSRQITVDEATALLGIFGGKARQVITRVEELTQMIAQQKPGR